MHLKPFPIAKKRAFLFFLALTSMPILTMDAWITGPSISIPKPRFATHDLSSIRLAGSINKATQSYNCQGKSVSLFALAGTEDLLNNFVDSTLSNSSTLSAGTALINGEFNEENLWGSFIQNIGNNFFITISSCLCESKLSSIRINPTDSSGNLLTKAEINALPALTSYLTKLNTKIFNDNSKKMLTSSSIGPSTLTVGYTKNYQIFDYIDFIDITFFSGIIIPTERLSKSNSLLLTMPFMNCYCPAIPLQTIVELGLYDWLNLGSSVLIMPFLSKDKKIRINTAPSHNIVLVPNTVMCSVKHKPLLCFNAYIEAEQLLPHLSFVAAFSYASQQETIFKSLEPSAVSSGTLNKFPTHLPWSIGSISFSSELDFATEEHKNRPNLKCLYVLPIFGRSAFKTSSFVGQISIEFMHEF